MKKKQILEAWRNEEYYLSLSEEERARIPEHPSGIVGVEDDILKAITGGCGTGGGGGYTTKDTGCPTSGYCTPCYPVECSA